MKFLDKIALAIFSVFMLVISIAYIMLYFSFTDVESIKQILSFLVSNEPTRNVFLSIAIVSILLSFKVIFFDADYMESRKSSIRIQGDNGLVEILPNTIENISELTVNNYAATTSVSAKMRSKKNGIAIMISCEVTPETNITDLTQELQKKIKERVERQTGATVVSVNIKVKDVRRAKEA